MGFGRVIGGALAGAGTGMAQLAESRELERRAMALENLRSQNQRVEMEQQAELQDRNAARDINRRTQSSLIIGEQEGRQAAAALEMKTKADLTKAEADRQHEIKKIIVGGQQDRMTAKAKAEFEAGNVADKVVDDRTGEWVLITKNGGRVPTGMKATEKERIYNPNSGGSGDDGVLAELRGGQAPAPTSTPPAASKPAAQPAKAQSGDRTMTMADIEATAQANGITKEMARRLLEQRGFKLKG